MTSHPVSRTRSPRRRSLPRSWVVGPLVVFLAVMVAPIGRGTAAPVPGSAGTDTALPPTASQVTVSGRDQFANLRVTLNQSAELTNQAISVTWTGGTQTRRGPGNYAAHFLQIFQCWGEDDGTNPANPGPPPEQCQQGAVGGQPGGVGGSNYPNGFTMSRIIARTNFPGYTPGIGVVETREPNGNVWMPFRAVDGTVVNFQDDPRFNPSVEGGNFWLNPYYNIITTNEVVNGRTGADGRGSELFQVQTGLEAPGLGCGQRVVTRPDGSKTTPRCWIVVVPRGTPAAENAGMGTFEDLADQFGVFSSPLAPNAWRNRIAIPIDFKPVESACSLSGVERRVVGSELIQGAISSWQPVVCGELGLPPFSYANIPDAAARQQLTASVAGGPGMVFVSQPLSAAQENPASPTVYAPISVSGIAIGFNIDRQSRLDAPPEAQALDGLRIAQLNFTPRLVAKLLTQSYQSQVTVGNVDPGYAWAEDNPVTLSDDPDFVRFNPEFELLIYINRLLGGLQLPAGSSDVANAVWEWILADPEARAWMDGEPDEWGMRVNPVYATSAAANSTGAPFGSPIPSSFPKADPFCYQAPRLNNFTPAPLCGTDWMPYTRSLRESALYTLAGNDTGRIVSNVFANAPSEYWRRDPPQVGGQRVMLSITDTASAQRFGLPMARLSRAGDNGATREFIAPTVASMTAGVAAMKSTPSGVLVQDSSASAPGAYPLTAIAWAAIKPLSLDQAARQDFSKFIAFAAGDGQTPGVDPGELPQGFAPLPDALEAAAMTAAQRVITLAPAPPPTTTVPTSVPTGEVASAPPTGGTPSGFVPSTSRPNTSSGSRPPSSPVATPPGDTAVTETSTPSEVTDTTEVLADEEAPATTVAADSSAPSTTIAEPALTPGLDVSLSRLVVALVSALALLSALFALELTKRARRAEADPAELTPSPALPPPGSIEVVPVAGAAAWQPPPPRQRETVDA